MYVYYIKWHPVYSLQEIKRVIYLFHSMNIDASVDFTIEWFQYQTDDHSYLEKQN